MYAPLWVRSLYVASFLPKGEIKSFCQVFNFQFNTIYGNYVAASAIVRYIWDNMVGITDYWKRG
jgi:hypothetical protein